MDSAFPAMKSAKNVMDPIQITAHCAMMEKQLWAGLVIVVMLHVLPVIEVENVIEISGQILVENTIAQFC